MTENYDGAAPTRDPDTVETDAHAESSAEELDEDRLRLDPLEAGMDPPERWSGADKYGTTPYEQAHPRGLTDRLAEEEPDVTGGALRFTTMPGDDGDADLVVVLDTTWTPPPAGPDGGAPRLLSLRDVAGRILASHDLIAETATRLDQWAATSGVIERLTIRDTSFWFYVRLRHWSWLEERILWAGIADALIREHRPGRVVCAPDADEALIDVLRLLEPHHGFALAVERVPEPQPETDSSTAAAARPSAVATRGASRPTSRVPLLRRLARRVRNVVLGPPPPSPKALRQQELAARVARVRELVEALAAEPESRLLVVHEHARQRVDTPDGPRSMNPYLDPIVDRLRGTTLEPIVLDIRARAGKDSDWERIGSGRELRLLPADGLAFAVPAPPDPAPRSSSPPPPPPPAEPAPAIDPVLAAWRDGLNCPVEAFGIDLGPLLAAEVVATASRFLPGMTASIDRIQRFLERVRPAGVVLADEYHRQDWMAAARSAGIPVAAVQHGMIYPRHNGYIHAARPDTLRLPQRTFVFGRWERDLLRTASVYRDDEVVVGGSPRLDLVRPEAHEAASLRRELGVADGERLVVVSGTWGGIYRRFHYPIALAALVDRPLPGVHIVVKLHPGEPDEGPYRRIIEGAAAARGFDPPRITTVQSIDLYRLLAAADAHLGIHSTVLTEAVVTRTPNLLADGLAGADLLGYVAAGVAVPVRDGGDLLAALGAAASGALREGDAAAFTAAHFEPGVASERIAGELTAWLA